MDLLKNRSISVATGRKEALHTLAEAIVSDVKKQAFANVTFICTHNSRRSQLAELMLSHLLKSKGILTIKCYSGGTEATAFNYRMVKALEDYGIPLLKYGPEENPLYVADDNQYLFSKKYDDPFNPIKDFIAVTTCNHADENCPVIFGAQQRFHIAYKDPKHADDTAEESQVYSDKVIEIGAEMLIVAQFIREKL